VHVDLQVANIAKPIKNRLISNFSVKFSENLSNLAVKFTELKFSLCNCCAAVRRCNCLNSGATRRSICVSGTKWALPTHDDMMNQQEAAGENLATFLSHVVLLAGGNSRQ
jgi:hypothetical protein